MVKYYILGGGPCGLGAATHLSKADPELNWILVDMDEELGGLASSFVDDQGFTWDIGGHVQFSHYKYFDDAMISFLGEDGWLHHERESWVWIRDRFVPYPFQNNIHRLPEDDLNKCLQGLVEITKSPLPKPANFQEWIHATFGPGLADVFMEPYNFKVWAHPLELMNSVWVGERVSVTELGRVLKNLVYKTDDVSWGPNNTFQFPKRGGTGAIWKACANQLPREKLRLGSKVVSIDLKKKICTTDDGSNYQYDHLISTIPLRELIKITGQNQLMPLAEKGLLYSASNIIGLGLHGKPKDDLAKKCWMYFPEDNCPFYRATVFSNYSPYNVPDPDKNWSLMLEVSDSIHKLEQHTTMVEDVIQGALNTGLITSRDEIISTWYYRAPYGYPVPGLHRDEALSEIIPFFEKHDVYSRGRFGMWKYEVSNQDHSFMQGVEIVERLLKGRIEITAFDAKYANSMKHPWPFNKWKQ
jgi:protoporphyrinogen oxidase